MSLKAKIEAVIYASEEPVTLAQLVGLLGEEGQSELDALDAQQQSLALEEAGGDPDALNAKVTEPEAVSAEVEAAEAEPETLEAVEDAETQVPEAGAGAPDSAAEKKAARERERKLREYFRSLLDVLIADYANENRGLEIREVANGYRLATKPEYHDAVRGFVKSLKPPLKLSLQALETLAVIAYKQPVTAPEISEIRGVDSGGVLGSLMTRKLIQTGGRKQVIGRPILYKTTKEFLLRFGLKDISELPSIEEFEKMAGELNDAVQEEMQMEDTEATAAGTPTSLDELNAAPEPTNMLHESAEELESDKSTRPEGHKHEAQKVDEKRAEDEPDENLADDVVVDGRISGVEPEQEEDPSAEEAEIQEEDAKR
jgi:segregation and condensation protein B